MTFLVQAHMHEQSSAMEMNTTTTKAGWFRKHLQDVGTSTACETSQVTLLNYHDVNNNVNICFYSSNDDFFLLVV